MRYLLIGGSGFIGKHLATELAKEHDVTITGRSKSFAFNNIDYKQLDFNNCTDFTDYIKDFDTIIHMVSTIIPSDDLSSINQEISDNVFPSNILFKNAAYLGKNIVFISSGGTVYGENESPNTENSPTNPICNYGISKLLIEKYLNLYHHFYNLDYKIIRLSNPYSEEIHHGKKQGVVPIIVDNIINHKTIPIWGKDQTRDYIHINDTITGITAILNYTGKYHIFNLGSGTGHTINDIIKLATSKLHQNASLEYYPARKCDVKTNILDITRITQETGWSPQITLSEGIDKIIKAKGL